MTSPAASQVAVLGTRYPDLSVEEEVLGPLGVRLVSGDGGSAADVLETARGAVVVLAGSRPRFDSSVVEALAADGCRGIVRYGIGTDSIDVEAAARAGLDVLHRHADDVVGGVHQEAVLHALTTIVRRSGVKRPTTRWSRYA